MPAVSATFSIEKTTRISNNFSEIGTKIKCSHLPVVFPWKPVDLHRSPQKYHGISDRIWKLQTEPLLGMVITTTSGASALG